MRTLARNGALAAILVGAACGRDTPSEATKATAEVEPGSPILSEDDVVDVAALGRALRRPHALIRSALGPHRLRYEAQFETSPAPPPRANPEEGAPVHPARAIRDELELVWASHDPKTPRFTLNQRNDAGRGRHVVRIGETLYTHVEHRPWISFPVESELDELWLDDAQRSAYDALAFIAPAVELALRDGTDDPTHLVVLDLSLASEPKPALDDPRPPTATWREHVVFTAIRGELTLDPMLGAWRKMRVDARYRIEGTPTTGSFAFAGTLEPLAADALPPIEPPADAEPLADRLRLDAEKRRLLADLAPG